MKRKYSTLIGLFVILLRSTALKDEKTLYKRLMQVPKKRYRHIFVEFQTLSSFLLLKINNMLEQVVFTLKTLCFIVNWYAYKRFTMKIVLSE